MRHLNVLWAVILCCCLMTIYPSRGSSYHQLPNADKSSTNVVIGNGSSVSGFQLKPEITCLFALETDRGLGRLYFLLDDRLFFVEQTKLSKLVQQEGLAPKGESPLAACTLFDQYTTSAVYWAKIEANKLIFYRDQQAFQTYLLDEHFLESIKVPDPAIVNQTLDREFLLHQYDESQRLLLAIEDELFVVDNTARYKTLQNIKIDNEQLLASGLIKTKEDSTAFPIWSELRGSTALVFSPLFEQPVQIALPIALAKKLQKDPEPESKTPASAPIPSDWKTTEISNSGVHLHHPEQLKPQAQDEKQYVFGDKGTLEIEYNCEDAIHFPEGNSNLFNKRLVQLNQHTVLQAFEKNESDEEWVWFKLKGDAHCYLFRFRLMSADLTPDRKEEMEELEKIVGSLAKR